MPVFRFEDRRIAYSEFGTGSRTVVLIHGLLLSQRMHEPLAKALAARGNRVVTIDLLGHGRSDRPTESWRYSVPIFAQQVVALLDHLELDEAVILGTSLGANTTLEVCRLAPERVRGMVVEMPVLDHALIASVVVLTPLVVALTFGGPLGRLTAAAARAVPEGVLPFWGNVLLDTVRQEPKPSSAVMQGLFSGRLAPNALQRRGLEAPTLVIGHRRDPIPPVRRRDARRRAAQRAPRRGQLDRRAAHLAAAADSGDRRLPRRLLEAHATVDPARAGGGRYSACVICCGALKRVPPAKRGSRRTSGRWRCGSPAGAATRCLVLVARWSSRPSKGTDPSTNKRPG